MTTLCGGRGADRTAFGIKIYSTALNLADDLVVWGTIAAAIKKGIDWIRKRRKQRPLLSVGALKYICFNELPSNIDVSSLVYLGAEDINGEWGPNPGYDRQCIDVYLIAFAKRK